MGLKKIVIIEDHQLFREGLKSMLSVAGGYEVIGEATDGAEGIRVMRNCTPDLVILDLSMPRVDGFSVLRELKRSCPEIKILVLTIHESNQYVVEAFRSGADGYCVKDSSREDLLTAVRATMEGKRYISPEVTNTVLEGYLGGSRQLKTKTAWETLTSREKEVLKLIAEDYQNKEIARILHISVKTVEKHRASLLQKLDLHSSVALTAYAYEQGLVVKNT
jgi:DNA-binding NarL/FixJ family response regulator